MRFMSLPHALYDLNWVARNVGANLGAALGSADDSPHPAQSCGAFAHGL